MTALTDKNLRGKLAETRALEFLQGQGLKIIGRNFRTRHGEIDLIMQHGMTIVFIEVRYRSNTRYMEAIETIDRKKIRKIILASRYFLQQQANSDISYRFDVIAMSGNIDSPVIDWIKDAFQE